MIPWIFGPDLLSQVQLVTALSGTAVFGFFGVLFLMFGVPKYEKRPRKSKEMVEMAYGFFICSALIFVFGWYFLVFVAFFWVAMFFIYLRKSVRIFRDDIE